MKIQLYVGVAFAALAFSNAAYAQSSGTIAAEEEEIVVTGSATRSGINGVSVPDAPKARTVLDNEVLRQAAPGQTVFQAVNIVPSVNFTNNDPSGASGGNIRIRGFDGNRISLTFDGLPLNDTGNYAVYTNQQLDPEIIAQVNVNQGTTDVDSPTAASSGGTINYRSLTPSEEFGAMVVGSWGQSYANRNLTRVFGMIQTGDILGTGVRGYVALSNQRSDAFRGPGVFRRTQFNAKLYKELGSNGDFIALSGHYNENRNGSLRSLTLAQATADYNANGRFTYDNNAFCARPTFVGGTAQSDNATPQPSSSIGADTSCSNYIGLRLNPSNTGNVRFNSKFSITDQLTFTVDAGYQYTLATGGTMFTALSETDPRVRGYAPGVTTGGLDLSGDGDTLDTVGFQSPNVTNTNRYTVLSSLRWDFSNEHYVRVAFAGDYGRHRQTGTFTTIDALGNPANVFGGRGGAPQVLTTGGYAITQRDRYSMADLNQISGEYRGKFFDNMVEVVLGVRAPFFSRELNQYCYTQASTGNPLCTNVTLGTTALTVPTGGNALNYLYIIPQTTAAAGQPTNAVYAPFQARYKYDDILPNVGVTVRPADNVQVYASYAKGLSAPRTDNLYRTPNIVISPETTDNFDVGVRYTTSMVQASFGGFYNRFKNRIVTSYDPDTNISVDRNVGRVEIKGLEASLNVRPLPWFSFRGFASYIDAQYKDNVQTGVVAGVPTFALTAGKRLVETPEWQYGYSARIDHGPASIGALFKQVTSRFSTDVNDQFVPGYNTLDLDARLSLKDFGLDKTFVQLNVNNVFDTQYLGSISSQTSLSSGTPTFNPGSPRSFVLSMQVGF